MALKVKAVEKKLLFEKDGARTDYLLRPQRRGGEARDEHRRWNGRGQRERREHQWRW
jgi:hypothetical protein